MISQLDYQFRTALRTRLVRPYRQFAEEEIILPSPGPRAGLRFRVSYMPWTGLVLDEFDRIRYRRFFGSGPAQQGKTLLFFGIPMMHHLFEVCEPVILGLPTAEMGWGIYKEKLLPLIERSRYRELLPERGAGSRGGKTDMIQFRHGVRLRFMGAGGGDDQKSSFTSKIVIMSELDKMDLPGASSRESDPVTQFETRTNAFGDFARIYGECTMSIEEGRVYQEVVENGTDTRIYHPCPHCGEYVTPEREGLIGWQGAADILTARERARYQCQKCRAEWDEDDRASGLSCPVLASKGQKVSREGVVEGPQPRTNTFGFRWNFMSSSPQMVPMAKCAEVEWRAEQSENEKDLKNCLQFYWALPYHEEAMDIARISKGLVLRKIGRHPKGTVPPGAETITVFIDLGLYFCWWVAMAWRDTAEGYVIDYGPIEVPHVDRQPDPWKILSALRAFRNDTLDVGWLAEGNQTVHFELCLVDSAWQQEIAYAFIQESGHGIYLPSHGYGTAKNQKGWRKMGKGPGRRIGTEWAITPQDSGLNLVNFNADHWKREVHRGLIAPPGSPGSISLFRADPKDHIFFALQAVAEKEEEVWEPGKGGRYTYWRKVYRHNHYLDCLAGNKVAADILGINTMPASAPRDTSSPPPAQANGTSIRTNY